MASKKKNNMMTVNRRHGETVRLTLEKKYRHQDPGLHLIKKHGRVHIHDDVGGVLFNKFQNTPLTIEKSNDGTKYRSYGVPVRPRDQLTFVGSQHVSEFDTVEDIHDVLQQKLLINLTFVVVDSDESSESTDSDYDDNDSDDDDDDSSNEYYPSQHYPREQEQQKESSSEEDEEKESEQDDGYDDDSSDIEMNNPNNKSIDDTASMMNLDDDEQDDGNEDTGVGTKSTCNFIDYICPLCICVVMLLVMNIIFLVLFLKEKE